MSIVAGHAAACAVGAVLGLAFFGGLRLTVERIATARRPALLVFASFVLRTAIVAAGFVWVGGGEWTRYVAALAGFLVARLVLVRLWGPARPAAAE